MSLTTLGEKTMAKSVVSNHMVAHIWAQRTQNSARSHNGNFWFEGATIYSYRTPIGRLVDSATGLVALVTCETFSMTTSCKHMNPIARALDYGRFIPIFYVPIIGKAWSHTEAEANAANLKHIENCYYETRQRLIRSRDRQAWALDGLRASYETRQQFALAFALDYTTRDVDADIREIETRWNALEAKRNDPAYIAKCDRERARKEERELAKHAAAVADYRAKLDDWRNGTLDHMPRLYVSGMSWRKARDFESRIVDQDIMLRVRGESVETSRGASVPVEHAKRLWRAIKACHATGKAWEPNGHAMPVGHFKVDRIEPNGDMRAGCHFIKFAELQRMSFALGLESPEVAQRGDVAVIA
jgi:hypothetical protein